MVEQSKELIEKFNRVFVERNSDCVGKEITFRPFFVYTALYGHTPRLTHQGNIIDESGTFTFMRGDNKDAKIIAFAPDFKSDYSFFDTCDNLGVVVYPSKTKALYITDIGIISFYSFGFRKGGRIYPLDLIDIFTDDEESEKMLEETVAEGLVKGNFECEETNNKIKYHWLKQHTMGLSMDTLEFDKIDVDLDKNYNDDLPYDRIKELLSSNSSELILFNGKPGTGKTTLIKKLMSDVTDKTFIYVNTSFLININTTTFIDFLLSRKNCVVVLEDCEKILLEREQGNPFMEVLLNLTDGIIGDTVKPKFICSFNCSENKIDKALLRLGRLSLKYTFNELSLEKTRRIIPEATKALTLADIYNYDETNMVGACSCSSRIGFIN